MHKRIMSLLVMDMIISSHRPLLIDFFNHNYHYITITSRYVHQRYITFRYLTFGGLKFWSLFYIISSCIDKNMLLPHVALFYMYTYMCKYTYMSMCIINHNYNWNPNLTLLDILFFNMKTVLKIKNIQRPLRSFYVSFVICGLFMWINVNCFLPQNNPTAPSFEFSRKKKCISVLIFTAMMFQHMPVTLTRLICDTQISLPYNSHNYTAIVNITFLIQC